LLVFDGDAAGVSASRKTAVILEAEGLGCDILCLENNEDPADILLKNGSQELKNLVKSSSTALEFLLTKAVSMSNVQTPEGKDEILEQLFPYIRSIQSAVKQEASLQIIAERLGVSSDSILDTFRHKSRENRRPGAVKQAENAPTSADREITRPTEERFEVSPVLLLMVAAVIHPENFGFLRSQLKPHDINGAAAQLLYSVLEDHFRKDSLDFDKIVADIDNGTLRNFIMRKAAGDEYGAEPAKYIETAVLRVRQDLLADRRRDVELRLKRAEQSSDPRGTRELLEEKIYLDAALKELKESIHDRTAE
jgi:DNA primase